MKPGYLFACLIGRVNLFCYPHINASKFFLWYYIYNMERTNRQGRKFIPIVVLVLLLAVFGSLLYFNSTEYKLKRIKNTVENVSTNQIDLTTAKGMDKVPPAFPKDIPIDTDAITESYTMDYIDRNMTQSVVTYFASQSQGKLYNMYLGYMAEVGFKVRLSSRNSEKQGYLTGTKNNDTLSIIITPKDGMTEVRLVYLDRP